MDTQIPSWVKGAVRFLEKNHSFQYMKRWLQWTINPDATHPYILSMNSYEFKKISLVRGTPVGGGRFFPITRIEPEDRDTREAGQPTGYWMDGVQNLILDSIPEEAYPIEAHGVLYTDWPADTTADHWLLRNMEEALLARTLMIAAVSLTDDKLYSSNKLLLEEELRLGFVSEEELQEGGKDVRIQWQPEWDEFDSFFSDRGL